MSYAVTVVDNCEPATVTLAPDEYIVTISCDVYAVEISPQFSIAIVYSLNFSVARNSQYLALF